MLKNAMKGNYIVPAFNFANFEILRGVVDSCIELKSPLILQVSESAMNYFGDDLLFGLIQGIRKIKHLISIHLDHGKTFEVVKRAIKLGFDSVMIDGSTLPYTENVKLTKKVASYAHARGVFVEGELGVLSVADDDATKSNSSRFTDPIQAKEFVALTGVDSLAVSIGTNHGVNKYTGEPKIHYDILRKIEKEIPKTPIVLHGASLVEQKYIDTINNFGGNITKAIGNEKLLKNAYKTHICKINMDTDFRLAVTASTRKFLAEHPEKYNPRDYGNANINEVKECAKFRITKICHSQNTVK